MSNADTDHELKESLDIFETALATPVVSGELAVWSDQVRAAWGTLSPLVERQVTRLHPEQYDEMTKQDPELFAHVENLKAEDAEIETNRQAVDRLVGHLTNLAPLIEPDERKFHDLQARLCDDGVKFVTRVRHQQVAVQTWYVEAFNRDRGNVD
jgi:hypothetical protein